MAVDFCRNGKAQAVTTIRKSLTGFFPTQSQKSELILDTPPFSLNTEYELGMSKSVPIFIDARAIDYHVRIIKHPTKLAPDALLPVVIF